MLFGHVVALDRHVVQLAVTKHSMFDPKGLVRAGPWTSFNSEIRCHHRGCMKIKIKMVIILLVPGRAG